MTKTCKICGKEFEAINHKKTCGPICSKINIRDYHRDPKNRARKSELERKRMSDPKNRERQRELRRKRMSDPKNRERKRELQRKWMSDPKNRERQRERQRKWSRDPRNQDTRRTKSRERYRNHGLISLGTQRFFLSLKMGELVNKIKTENMKTNKKTAAVVKIPSVREFLGTFEKGMEFIREACGQLAAMVDANPNVFDEIITLAPNMSYNMLESMRRVGINELYWELLFDSSDAARALLRLPMAQQKELYTKGARIVKFIDGKNVVEEKPLKKCSRMELTLLIDPEKRRARNVEEQIPLIRPASPAKVGQRFKYVAGGIEVMAKTILTTETLRQCVEHLESEALKSLPGTLAKNQIK